METKDTLSSCSNSEEQQIQDKAKKSCNVSFRQPHSHLKLLLNNDFKGTRTESGFKHAFATFFGQDIETFTGTMFLYVDQLEKQLDKEEFQEIGSMAAFKTTEDKVDSSKALDVSLVDTKSSGTTLKEQDTRSRSGNDAHADDADIRPIYDEELMAEVNQNAEQCHDTCPLPATLTDNQTTELSNQSLESENIRLKKTVAQFQKYFSRMEAHCVNIELKYQNQVLKEGKHGQFSKVKSNEAKVKYDIDVIEIINIELEHKVAKLLKENETLKKHYKELYDSIKTTRAWNIDHTTSLIAKNDDFKAQLQEKGFSIAALKNELRKLTGNSVNTKFSKSSILGKPALQPCRNQSVVRQPTAFKSERPRISKQRFASQVDVNNDLSKPVTTHYLPKERESAVAKPHHMIAPGSSRYSSNDMVHNHYLEEAKKKTQESCRNSEPSVMPSARSQSTLMVQTQKHSQKCVFNENHDSCVTKFLNEVNSRAKVPSNKIMNRNKPVEQTSFAKKPERQIPKGHRFSIKKTSVMHEKTMTPRSCLRWKPTSKIFKTVGLRWVPTGKIFTSSTTKVDSEPPNGSNEDITNPYECKQTLDVSAGTLNLSAVQNLKFTTTTMNRPVQSWFQKLFSFRQDSYITDKIGIPFHHYITMLRIHKDGDGDASFQLESDSLPHAHAQTTKTYYKHQDSRIMKAQELKTKTSAQTLIYKIFLQRYQVYQGRLLASFQDDAKYEHVGQDTRSQGGKDDQDGRIKI
ncbi:hypothetical protein Tco_0299374 [Tanacetum coccineum]